MDKLSVSYESNEINIRLENTTIKLYQALGYSFIRACYNKKRDKRVIRFER